MPTSLARLFPGHPGLSWNVRLNLSTSAARSVLSMNCEQSSRFHRSYNDLICTGCSPNYACEKPVNNANQSVKSSDSHLAKVNYSQHFQVRKARGEQVLFWKFQKNPRWRRRATIMSIGCQFTRCQNTGRRRSFCQMHAGARKHQPSPLPKHNLLRIFQNETSHVVNERRRNRALKFCARWITTC